MITEYSEFPKFDDCFMPVLETLNKEGELQSRRLEELIYKNYYKEYSLDVLAGKSNYPLIYSRIHRAKYFLFAGKYISRVKKAVYAISDKGKKFLKNGKTMTYQYLCHEDEDFKNSSFNLGKGKGNNTNSKISESEEKTPEERLQDAYELIEAPRKDELLARCREIDPIIFEKIVGKLCEAMGYGTFIETQKSRDGGIDGIIKGDSLGFDKIYIQAKRYAENNIVQGKEMQNFVGALASNGVKRGIFFTTSGFSETAKKKADDALRSGHNIILIDGKLLVNLMFKYNVGVQSKEKYVIKDIDEDFFGEFN